MNTTLPPMLEMKLADFRRRVWVVKLAEGVLAACFGLALSYLLVFALDRFFETPEFVRFGLLLAGAATLGLGLPWQWHRWVWRQRRLEDAARLLRRSMPRLGDQLLGIVELARMDHGTAGRSERLVAAAMAQADEAIKDRDFSQAVPAAKHRQWGWAVAGVGALSVAALVGVNEAARNALLRWAMPWRQVERYTFVRVEPLPSRLVVPYAEPFQVPVKLATASRWSPAESRARIGQQPAVTAPLEGAGYALAFPPQKEEGRLGLSLGDVRKSMTVVPETRPELEGLAVRLKLPDYLGYQSEPRLEIHGGTVSLLKGAQAAFEARASRELATAQLDGRDEKVSGGTMSTEYQSVNDDADRKFTWRDRDGLTPREPLVLKVRAVADEAPTIVARRDSLEQVVLDSEVVNFEVTAGDDFGVKRVGLEWTGAPAATPEQTPAKGESVSAGGSNEKREVAVRATFCATRDGVAPQVLEVRAWAEDYLPGRPRSHSASFLLYVLNKTDHALWLTEQFGKWLEGAKETYEREQALHQTNQELRALSAQELDRPENRRRVSQQAAAENGNAARLESLTDSGRHLVEQATKNDEFDAKRLESWATMLKSLQQIAGQRMPSVSDLLKQTAGAPAGQPGAQPKNGSPTEPSSKAGQTAQANPAGSQSPQAKSAPSLVQGEPPAGSATPPSPTDPNAPPKPAAPSIADNEKGFGPAPAAKPADPNAAPKPPGGGKLRLPGTTLAAAPAKKGDDQAPPPESPAQEKMENAVTEQKDLLAEFAKVSDQLNQILSSLEASTFVKRFKAASRQQVSLASNINQKTLDAFGIERKPLAAALPLAQTARSQSEVVRVIQSDLDAYSQRKQDSRFKNILEEMRKTEIVPALAHDGEQVEQNLSGQSMNGSEYWADVLDRWAEELVAASNCKSCSNCSGDSLPPEIVLKVMQALRDEMALRDETREVESAKSALENKAYAERADQLSTKQAANRTRTHGAQEDIASLPQGQEKFGKELKLLQAVVQVMDEADDLLSTPETGPRAIAAETEAIELLLQAKRQSPKGGGGGGSNPGGGGTGSTTLAALAELGPGSDVKAAVVARPVGQATGRTGKEFPEEFKPGLESYFNLLEGQSSPR